MSISPASPEGIVGQLAEEGYSVALLDGNLVVFDVPFASSAGAVATAELIIPLAFSAGRCVAPRAHQAWWTGEPPREADGSDLRAVHAVMTHRVTRLSGLRPAVQLCLMATGREYVDYSEFVNTYVAVLGTPAAMIDPSVTARTRRRPTTGRPRTGPFTYVDTASTRAGLGAINERLAGLAIGIVGLGGTGSYVLDLVAKTCVDAIHLFDDDLFEQHSAFRAPGAATMDDIRARRPKVHHFAEVYGAMHRGIVPHAIRIDATTAGMLDVLDFVFLCIDDAQAKPAIMGRLSDRGIPYVDVGMGIQLEDRGITGAVRTTMVAPGDDVAASAIPTIADPDGVYASNIQVADLNALNAVLAVGSWKRLAGFYPTQGGAHGSVYVIESGRLHSDGQRLSK